MTEHTRRPLWTAHTFRARLRRARAKLRRLRSLFTRSHPAHVATRQDAWASHKAAKRKRRKAETLLGRIAGLPRSWRPYVTGWVVMHPAAETKAARTPVRRRIRKADERAASKAAARANPVPRGRLSNPTALR